MNDTSFTTVGDEPVEARIVAWVLGEASGFEVSELERLCEERPELLVFHRRMLTLHGLLAEASQVDHSWKLPPEKRKPIDEILGLENHANIEAVKEKRVRRSSRRILMAIAACLMMTFVVFWLVPSKYESEAVIEVRSRQVSETTYGQLNDSKSATKEMHSLFFRNEFEKIKSRKSLEKVVDNLALENRWKVDKETALRILKDSVHAKNIRDTDLISIRARHKNAIDARDIAHEVTNCYKNYRDEIESRNSANALQEFNKAVRDQEDKVEERRKLLATIDRAKSASTNPKDEAIKRRLDAQDYVDARRDFEADVELLKSMKLKQVSEAVAQRTPIQSVEVHDQPIVAAKRTSLASDLLAKISSIRVMGDGARELMASNSKPSSDQSLKITKGLSTAAPSVSLTTPLPNELIEGTPKSINVPHLEVPVNGPAGYSSWKQAKKRDAVEDMKDDFIAADEVPDGALAANAALPAARQPRPRVIPPVGEKRVFAEGSAIGMEIDKSKDSFVEMETLSSLSDASSRRRGRENANVPLADSSSDSHQEAIRQQEEKVEERRKLLATIVRTKGVIYKGADSFYAKKEFDEDQGARNALEEYQKLESDRTQLQSQINSLLKYDSDQLMVYAAGLDLPDNMIRNLLPQYQEAKRQFETLKIKGLGNNHPDALAAAKQISSMKSQLDEGVVNLRVSLHAQLDLADKRLTEVEKRKNETREEAIKRGLDAQDYVDAKQDFEKEQELLQQLKLKAVTKHLKSEKPKLNIAQLMEEISATEEPYSTFSLNISDASFQIVQAALAKGERPDSAGIKVEQFYNAVDYGDPAPSAGEPVALAIEQAAHPIIPGRNLVRVALKTAAAGRSASQALRLTLLVDQSGSMVREDRRAAMDKALGELAGLLTENDVVSVIGFSRTPRLLADGMAGNHAGKLPEIVNQSASEGGTNLEEAIRLAGEKARQNKLAGAQNRIVLFTDGAANLGNADPARLAEKVKELRQNGIAFDIAGIAADGLNDELLAELARNGNGRYYVVGKGDDDSLAKQLAGAFRPAAENVKLQVRFNPERVGRYKLIGFEKDRLKTEDFRNDAVDAAELAAEEAGVAIYQVETLPEGHGELGDVSVRFRDSANSEMVERSWTIPHELSSASIERATPSMQLALISMFAAEKLKGAPLGEAIDFKQLAPVRANVKQFYGNTGRIAEMLRMIDSL